MKTINEIKDSVAQKHGYDDWDDLAKSFCYEPDTYVFFHNCENEASIAYATMAIEEQKKSCLTAYYVSAGWKDADNRVADAINNAPNVR